MYLVKVILIMHLLIFDITCFCKIPVLHSTYNVLNCIF